MIKHLEKMQEEVIKYVHEEMKDLSTIDTCELGDAIDIIKDLSEAIYYHTIVESMKAKESTEWSDKTTHVK